MQMLLEGLYIIGIKKIKYDRFIAMAKIYKQWQGLRIFFMQCCDYLISCYFNVLRLRAYALECYKNKR